MTFQVSDTDLKTKPIRSAALRHALSYMFGAIIIAVTINLTCPTDRRWPRNLPPICPALWAASPGSPSPWADPRGSAGRLPVGGNGSDGEELLAQVGQGRLVGEPALPAEVCGAVGVQPADDLVATE
jgi:hypothetical protein